MANKEHVKRLLASVGGWNAWRLAEPDVRPDLSEADLQRARLMWADLRGADLSAASLRETDLAHSDLTGADMSKASCTEAEFLEANLAKSDLSKAIFVGAKLSGANLEGADLLESNLLGANLRYAHLVRANCAHANLREADLAKTNLSLADLSRAGLIEAILTGADLSGANLRAAMLFGASLMGARLSGTDLTGAELGGTVLASLDLCEPLGLEMTVNYGPSGVGTDTLIRTAASLSSNRSRQGAIEQFLREAGLDDRYLEFFRSTIGSPIEFYSCFVSYSHDDASFARHLHDHLQARGIRCWLDEHQLLPGDKFLTEIDRGIRLWDKVLLCCSRASLEKSWWVDKEIDKALRKEEQLFKERGREVLALIPLDLDGYLLDGWDSPKTSLITDRLAADFTGWETDNAKFEEQFEKVVRALRTDDGARPKAPASKL